jgi:hypothetical protein
MFYNFYRDFFLIVLLIRVNLNFKYYTIKINYIINFYTNIILYNYIY